MWRLGRLVAIVAVAAACGGSSGGAEAADPTTTAPPTTAEITEVEPAAHLPPVASPVAVFEDIAVYFAEEDGHQRVVAVDLTEERALWSQPSHQHGRITGVVDMPLVDGDARQVVVTDYDGHDSLDGNVTMAAYDVATGTERWRVDVRWAEEPLFRCVGESQLCLTHVDGIDQYNADGELVGSVREGGLERTIAGRGDLRLTSDAGQHATDIALGRLRHGAYQIWWRQPFSAFADTTGYGPDGGWSGDVELRSGHALFWVGGLPPAAAYEGEGEWEYTPTPEEMRRGALAGHLIGLADDDGMPLLGLTGAYDCRDLPFEVGQFWTCERVGVVEEEDRTGDGVPDPEPVFRRLVRRSAAHPDGDLVVDLPVPLPYYGHAIEATSDPERFVLRPKPGAGDPLVLDTTTGALAPADEHPELLTSCALAEESATDGDRHPLVVELRTLDGARRDYLTLHGPLGLCAIDGTPVAPERAIAAGSLPATFGIATDVAWREEHQPGATSRGWVLWTETDRLLRVAKVEVDPDR